MKKAFLLLFLLSSALSGCVSRYERYDLEPIYMPEAQYTSVTTIGETSELYMPEENATKGITLSKPQKLQNTGKIYLYKNFIFVNEINKGVHIIDNSNPRNPVNNGFIKIPFNADIAIKDDTLYADNLNDLVALDISDINNIKEVKRIKKVFRNQDVNVTDKGIQIGYKQKKVTEYKVSLPVPTVAYAPSVQSGTSVSGTGGSMARFMIDKNHLYTLDNDRMHLFNIQQSKTPEELKVINNIGRGGIETIFASQDKLFIGSQFGMYIYDNTNPAEPEFISEFEHARSCDPVVVEGDKAYVTLRSGSACRNGNNQLDIIDLSEIKKPTLVKSYPMTNPHGLAIAGGRLFICDGTDGLKVFDARDAENINLLKKLQIKEPLDLILNGKTAIVISKEGLLQYDFSELESTENLELLSKIAVEKPEGVTSGQSTVQVGEDTFYYRWYKDNF